MSGGGGSPDPFPGRDPFAAGNFSFDAGQTGGPVSDLCAQLRFTARLRSVNRDELDAVNVGDVLAVHIFRSGRPQIGAFRLITVDPPSEAAEPVGVLLDRLPELLPCLEQREFEAVVRRMDGGTVHVQVRPAQSGES